MSVYRTIGPLVLQNDKALVKLLLNNSYIEEKTSNTDTHHGLKRMLSRHVFAIKPASHTPEPIPEEQDDEKGEEDEEDQVEEEDEENEEEQEEGIY